MHAMEHGLPQPAGSVVTEPICDPKTENAESTLRVRNTVYATHTSVTTIIKRRLQTPLLCLLPMTRPLDIDMQLIYADIDATTLWN
eukprot:SAG31_NODE_3238_length_4507_cov_14.674682_7_plen_86_part_00